MDTQRLIEEGSSKSVKDGAGHSNIVLVGLPGAGKSSVGKRLAARLGLPFADADAEIEAAAGMSIADIFAAHGEPAFREGEERVIARLMREGPMVIATGGGAFMSEATRSAIKQHGISVWLDASTEVLLSRIVKRSHRPLFHGVDPRQKLLDLRAARDPVFAKATLRIASSAGPHDRVVNRIINALRAQGHLSRTRLGQKPC
ncbi:MAG: shikimate kinase [Pseudomonadota bacterium]